jgi:hypothetical protein
MEKKRRSISIPWVKEKRRLKGKKAVREILRRTPFMREASVAPPLFRVKELNAKAKA